jgi:mRNA-degrading endonuclease toxin of MazEF toxin-antitoxin module
LWFAKHKDSYKDLVLCAISSVLPKKQSVNEILLRKDKINNLRVDSIVKVDRITTAKRADVLKVIGKLNEIDLGIFKEKFRNLIDS